ncbi:uncharacterized protein ACRADG_007827 [Cochliomyia hominivorax]
MFKSFSLLFVVIIFILELPKITSTTSKSSGDFNISANNSERNNVQSQGLTQNTESLSGLSNFKITDPICKNLRHDGSCADRNVRPEHGTNQEALKYRKKLESSTELIDKNIRKVETNKGNSNEDLSDKEKGYNLQKYRMENSEGSHSKNTQFSGHTNQAEIKQRKYYGKNVEPPNKKCKNLRKDGSCGDFNKGAQSSIRKNRSNSEPIRSSGIKMTKPVCRKIRHDGSCAYNNGRHEVQSVGGRKRMGLKQVQRVKEVQHEDSLWDKFKNWLG